MAPRPVPYQAVDGASCPRLVDGQAQFLSCEWVSGVCDAIRPGEEELATSAIGTLVERIPVEQRALV
jgi:hypothetical protein